MAISIRSKSPPQTLSDLPAWGASHFGHKTALVTDEGNLSFTEIERRVASVAGGLRSLGVGADSRVVLHLPNSWEWIVAYYAIARVGAAVAPANILLVPREVAFIASDCGATAVIAPVDRIDAIKAAGCTSRHLIGVGAEGEKDAATASWSRLLSDDELVHTGSAEPSQVCTIGYTSGTTGKPKGALLPHRAVVLNTAMTSLMHARTQDDVVLTALPCPHVYGNVVMNGAFLVGYTLVLMRRFDAEEALSLVEQHRVTIVDGVPTMYYYLLGTESLGKADLSSLVRCTVGGQTMPTAHMQEVQSRLGCPLHELWGMTEIAGLGTTHPAHAAPRLGSIGQPIPFTECRVVSIDDSSKVLLAGEIGELMVRGPTVMTGYHGQEAATKEAIEPDGWLHTGDLARRDEDGFYFVVDRKKEMIITAGYNIYPSEVERVIAKHPAVQIVAVGAVSDSLKGEAAHAFIVRRPSVAIDETELRDFCRQELAAYKVPKGFHFVSDLPKTSTGKIVRRELSKLLEKSTA